MHGIPISIFLVGSRYQENQKMSGNEIANVHVYWDLITLTYISYILSMVADNFPDLFNLNLHPKQSRLLKN